MGDPYRMYGCSGDPGSMLGTSFPGYLLSEAPTLAAPQLWNSNDLRGSSSDFLLKDILPSRPGAYGTDGFLGTSVHPEPNHGGLTAGGNIKGYPPPEDPSLLGQRRDPGLGIRPGIPEIVNERPVSLKKADTLSVATNDSNVLFVDGLPTDCTRREVGHLFRPFIGFKDIRVVHKEARRSGDKAMVFCFVEFADANCALTAMDALEGYKFDDKKPDSPVLRIHFAHFPFHLPSNHDGQ